MNGSLTIVSQLEQIGILQVEGLGPRQDVLTTDTVLNMAQPQHDTHAQLPLTW